MTLIEGARSDGSLLRLWIADGWDAWWSEDRTKFLPEALKFRRAPGTQRLEQWCGSSWRPVTVLTRTTQGEAA